MDEFENEEMTLDDLEMMIMKAMKDMKPTDPEYLSCLKNLKEIKAMRQIDKESERAEAETQQARVETARAEASKWSWIIPTVCQTAGNVLGSAVGQWINKGSVKYMVDAEKDGYIMTSRATGVMSKPR